jgi:type I restriction-modification system DNA methylase subunit
LDREGFKNDSVNLWSELKALCDIVDSGNRRYEVPPYNGGLFSAEEHPFLEDKEIPDGYVALILDQLSRAAHHKQPELGLFRVDYRDLAIQQLGSVYEGLLELRPRYATEDMIVVRNRTTGNKTERIIPMRETPPTGFERTEKIYGKGAVYLETDKGERRAFGSYYTPDHIVNHMVNASLGKVCRNIERSLRTEIEELDRKIIGASSEERAAREEERRILAGSFSDRVLTLSVLDPAMGSGHFLIRACQYLAEEIATNPLTGDPEAQGAADEDAWILLWKRRVAERCLYGVDVNPMAVELAKLALWLETVAIDAPLAFLDHHLQTGDSLIGSRIVGLDSLPGRALTTGVFKEQIETGLPSLLEPLEEIRALPSSTLADVKRKEQIFKRRFRTAEQRFEKVADVWCAAAVGALPEISTPTDYAGVIQTLTERRRNGGDHTLIETARGELANFKISPFHWELAFPEVFLRTDRSSGFDVVIGNPPYDVLAEKEAGERVGQLRTFIRHDASLRPSVVGKNNLYKLFICRAVELLRDGGHLSFIVPMPLLGDEQASGIRKALLREGTFEQIHTFPQKDNVARRVFRDAKLSTALFVFRKGADPQSEPAPFQSVRHVANTIDTQSPSLMLRATEPNNLTIVSCSQDDWNLAVRVMQRSGIRRLGSICKSYQGEVNETTDRDFLSRDAGGTGRLVLRGANICMYVVREASQGLPLYLDAQRYQRAKANSEKAFHSRADRVGFQRSAPQNNFRRVIAAYVPAGEFCFDTVSYIPRGTTTLIDLDLLIVLLNSKLIDWYFTIGSTNSKVNEYQFNNLPCPIFGAEMTTANSVQLAAWLRELERSPAAVMDAIASAIEEVPFNPAIAALLIELSRRIRSVEEGRGPVGKAARAHLADAAKPLQDLTDAILFRMAGFSESEVSELSKRLAEMA